MPNQKVRKTRGFWGESPQENFLCQEEIKFVKGHNLVKDVINCNNNQEKCIERLMTHGDVLDFAFPFLNNMCDAVILLEPDCLITGKEWWNQFEKKLEKKWIIGSNRLENKDSVTRFCPSAWKIKEINNVISSKKLTFNKYGNKINTGQKIMRECFDQMDYVKNLQGIVHFEGGSSKHFTPKPYGFCKMI